MSDKKSCWATLAYFIIGLIVIGVALRVIWWLIRVTVAAISVAVSVAIIVGVGYLTYLLIKAAIASTRD